VHRRLLCSQDRSAAASDVLELKAIREFTAPCAEWRRGSLQNQDGRETPVAYISGVYAQAACMAAGMQSNRCPSKFRMTLDRSGVLVHAASRSPNNGTAQCSLSTSIDLQDWPVCGNCMRTVSIARPTREIMSSFSQVLCWSSRPVTTTTEYGAFSATSPRRWERCRGQDRQAASTTRERHSELAQPHANQPAHAGSTGLEQSARQSSLVRCAEPLFWRSDSVHRLDRPPCRCRC
jgi:hypothetical protein